MFYGIKSPIEPVVICDRATAIRTAILQAQPGDGILIAGKGHEDYQILGTEKIHLTGNKLGCPDRKAKLM